MIREEDKDCGSAFEARQLAVIHLIIGVAYTILTFGARFFILPRLGGSSLVMLIAGIMVFYGAYIPFYSYSQKICGENDLMEYSGEAMGFGLIALFITECIILGAIYSGVASPTEAAVISVFYSLVVSLFIYKTIHISQLWSFFGEAMRTYAPILFILTASMAFSRVITLMQVPQIVSDWMLGNFTNAIILLLVINLFLLLVGMVMDTTPAILILTPILLPITTAIGLHPIHFGVMMVVNLAIGFVTPPIGVNLFVASSLTKISVMQIARKAVGMIALFLFALLLITFVPAISLMLL